MSDLASTPTAGVATPGAALNGMKLMPERRSFSVTKATTGGYIVNVSIQGGEYGWRDEQHLFTDKASIAEFIKENLDN